MQIITRAVRVAGICFAFVFLASMASVENMVSAEVTPFPSREKTISVSGTATASIEPDLLVVTFGAETREKTAIASLLANSAAMTSIVDSVRILGITDDEISTSGLSIYPVYDGYTEPITGRYVQELAGYEVTNIITIKTPQLDMAAEIIDGAVSAGATRVDGVSFTLSPQNQLDVKDELIGKAVLNAKKKAENALAPLDHKIIGVKAVNLSEFGMPMYRGMHAYADTAMAESTPVFSSDQRLTATANIVFLIGSN